MLLQLNGVVPHDNLVLIKMRPDEHGRFGFNVKVRDDTSWAIHNFSPDDSRVHHLSVKSKFVSFE